MSYDNSVKLDFTQTEDLLIAGDHVQTSTVLAVAGVAIKRGELLSIDPATNIAGTSTDPTKWQVISAVELTVDQANSHAAAGIGYPVYNQGEFYIDGVYLNGAKLTAGQYDAAMATGTVRNIELRKAV